MQYPNLSSPAAQLAGSVLVIGGGVAGVQAALDMTHLGLKVYLVEKSAAIGGVMARIDKTFPSNDCSLCILAPKLVESGRDANIDILTRSEIVSLSGEPGNFTVTIRKHPRYIDETTCTGCGQCAQYCLKQIDDDYNENLGHTSAIHIDYAPAVPATYAIDPEKCLRLKYGTCGVCEVVCQKKSINFNEEPQTLTLTVGAVVLAPGFGRIKQEVLAKYGWGKFPDVLTAFEHERLMCASGPTGGEIIRPSDRKHPKKIAFLQCIGSRDETCGNNYCSSVCCMYAIKQATLAREHNPEAEITLFYMDIRTHGKGFDAARERASRENNFRVIYARPPKVEDVFDGRMLLTWTSEDGLHHFEKFDLVVLSQGLESPDDAKHLAAACGISLNKYQFASTGTYAPLATDRPGVYVIGAFQGPKDIPDSVVQGSAAGLCSALLAGARHQDTVEFDFPTERDISSEEPRIGVFVCHCGTNIGGVVNVLDVAAYARTLPHVVYATNNLYPCSQDTQSQLADTIRDQCSWVHMHEPREATDKARDLVRASTPSKFRQRQIKPACRHRL